MKLLPIVLLLTLSACTQISSNEVDASAIFGELSLKREEGLATAKAKATFFVGGGTGSVVKMDDPAKVEINGAKASEVTDPIINLISYEANVSGDATILYTDKEGTSYSNVLRLPGSMSLSLPSATAFISKDFVLNFNSSNAFIPGESLEVILSISNQAKWISGVLPIGSTTGSYTIKAQELADFQPGTLMVSVCRRSSPNASAPYPKGTYVQIESCSQQKAVNLQP